MSEGARAQGAETSEHDFAGVLREGLREFDRGNWVEARTLFERAHKLQPSARTLRAIGFAAFEQKNYVTAHLRLTAALADTRKPLTEEQRREAREVLQRAEAFVARYTVRFTPGSASVQVDGEPPVIVGDQLLLDPGLHDVVVSAPQYRTAQRQLQARPREDGVLEVALEPVQRSVATADRPVEPVAPTEPLADRSEEDGLSTSQIVGVAIAGAGALSLGASLIFAIRAKSQYDDSGCADGGCADATAKALNDDALESGDIATYTLIGGLVAAGAGTFLILWSPSEEKAPTGVTRIAPTWSPALAGLEVEGRF